MLYKATVAVCSDNTITECNLHLECANVKTVGKESCWQTLKVERVDCTESYRICFDVTSVGHFKREACLCPIMERVYSLTQSAVNGLKS